MRAEDNGRIEDICKYPGCNEPAEIREEYEDIESIGYCLFHSQSDRKSKEFYEKIFYRINEMNEQIEAAILRLDDSLSKDEREREIEIIRNKNNINFTGYYFPGDTDFRNIIFKGNANFSNSMFNGDLIFLSSNIFEIRLSFHNAAFVGNAYFGGITYKKEVDFSNAKFNENSSFQNAKFNDEANFSGALFNGEILFNRARFNKYCNFNKATFNKKAKFFGAIFNHNVNFEESEFKGSADFQHTLFQCRNNKGEVKFQDAKFFEKVEFNNSIFNRRSYFMQTIFYEQSSFYNVIFNKSVDFSSAYFEKEVNYHECIFRSETKFIKTKFKEAASFISDIFLDKSYFEGIYVIKNKIIFRNIQFLNDCTFNQSNFSAAGMQFINAAFLGKRATFNEVEYKTAESFFSSCTFRSFMEFNKSIMKGVYFTNCYLGGSTFLQSDVREAVLINCSWSLSFLEEQIDRWGKPKIRQINSYLSSMNKRKDLSLRNKIEVEIENKKLKLLKNIKPVQLPKYDRNCFRSNILFDEIIYLENKKRNLIENLSNFLGKRKKKVNNAIKVKKSEERRDPFYLESLYNHFKQNMDLNSFYSQANDFYFGEKLWERKKLFLEWKSFKKGWFVIFLKWLFLYIYWSLSGYGNRPFRTLINFIVGLFLASYFLLLFNGVHIVEKNYARVTTIQESSDSSRISKSTDQNISLEKDESADLIIKPIEGNFWCHIYYLSMWNLQSALKEGYIIYQPNGWFPHFILFLIQYVYRPLMVTLFILAVRRKVKR